MSQPPVESRYTASTGMTWLLLAYLRFSEVDVAGFAHKLGLRVRDLMGPDVRMSLVNLHRLWRAAAELTGDEALGVRIAAQFDPQSSFSWPPPFSLYEHVGRASASLREGIERQAKLIRLLRDGLQISIEGPADRPITRFDFGLQSEPRALIEFHLAAGLLLARRIVGDNRLAPAEVWLARPEPADVKPYADLFQAPLRWGAEHDAIVSFGDGFEQALPTSNPVILAVIEHRASKLLEALPAVDDFVELVRERIEAELPDGNTNASAVAEKLGMSPRTLHRRLQAEGTSYQDVLDKVRCRLATRHLSSRRHSINEVAAMVGFAQPSAFHRAFKGWTGETPAEYQERMGMTGSAGREPRRGESQPPRR